MKPIVCQKSRDDLANVQVTTLKGENVKLEQSSDFSFTGETCFNIKKKMLELHNQLKAGEIAMTDTEVYLHVLSKVYGRKDDWFLKNMDLKSIGVLYGQVMELINGDEKNE